MRWIILTALFLLTGCVHQPPELKAAKHHYQTHHYPAAINSLKPLAVKGNADAQYTLAYMIYYGLGTPANSEQAFNWIRQAAAQGHPKALQALARFYQKAPA